MADVTSKRRTQDQTSVSPTGEQSRVERRRQRAQPRAEAGGVVLSLPAHRIVPGATIVFDGEDGTAHRLVLPEGAAPGRTVPVVTDGQAPRLMLLVSA